MISSKILEDYFEEYATRPIEWVIEREKVKRHVVQKILEITGFVPTSNPVKVAVLGASDKRYIGIHRDIFREAIQKDLEMTTFDIDTQHLTGEDGIIEQDVTRPFPSSFDIVFSHSLLKFIEPEKQVTVLRNSHNALKTNGLAMHIMHCADKPREWQHKVDTDKMISKLVEENISCKKIKLDIDNGTDVLVTQKGR